MASKPPTPLHFYRYRTRPEDRELTLPLPDGYEARMFIPKWSRIEPPGLREFGVHRVWYGRWLMRLLGMFSRPEGYQVSTIYQGRRLVHLTVVLPRHRKFAFMGENDFQASPVWTAEDHRRKGLAGAGMSQVKKAYADCGGYLWYVVRVGLEMSNRHISKCGFRRYATGIKGKTLGLRVPRRLRDRGRAGLTGPARDLSCGAAAPAGGAANGEKGL